MKKLLYILCLFVASCNVDSEAPAAKIGTVNLNDQDIEYILDDSLTLTNMDVFSLSSQTNNEARSMCNNPLTYKLNKIYISKADTSIADYMVIADFNAKNSYGVENKSGITVYYTMPKDSSAKKVFAL